jgi:poly-gamma-glutamate synthase PgsB/CapB
MNPTVIAIASVLLLAAGLIENSRHRRLLSSIPIRVNVNGTRGKSTVTRLIAAGLTAGGIKTAAKTTGTAPRIMLPDGTEEPIKRRGKARISEHIWVVKRAHRSGAKALVAECMALEQENQRVYEGMLVLSTIGVITNIRPDHLDVMGPGLEDVARTLALTVPKGGYMVATDGPFINIIEQECIKKGTKLVLADAKSVSADELALFGYTSFAENVAIAIKACELAGVDRETALRGMQAARPDPGVSPIVDLELLGRNLHIVNAFAANDVESTIKMWDDFAKPVLAQFDMSFIMVNNREDRPQRVEEMSVMAASLPVDRIFFIGKLQTLAKRLTPKDAAQVELIKSGKAQDMLDAIMHIMPEGGSALVLLAGNTKGAGSLLTDYISSISGGGPR